MGMFVYNPTLNLINYAQVPAALPERDKILQDTFLI